MVYKVIYKDPPKEVDIKHGYYTFWDKVVRDEDYANVDLCTGEKEAYWDDGYFNLVSHRAGDRDPSNLLHGREFITADLGVVIPVKVIYLFEPTEEEISDDVEVEDTLLIARSEIIEGDIIIS